MKRKSFSVTERGIFSMETLMLDIVGDFFLESSASRRLKHWIPGRLEIYDNIMKNLLLNRRKLTARKAMLIRASELPYAKLADIFNVSPRTIGRIKKRSTYKTSD